MTSQNPAPHFTSGPALPPGVRARNVTAVLGPTNTGKTHLAIERMLGHRSGMIGLPLRLLAREVYQRVAERIGADRVALITGEERLIPREPNYWICTVEAMPRDIDVAFVAIDEVQLAANLERGHVFTDRILNMRGREETLLLGAATMRPLFERLLPGVNVITRPRMSQLTYAGQKKITRQPERSAIVAFSAAEVYEIAELLRRQRGGAAVVLGSLSPRTRNAQVDLYQNGDVQFLVATDAIGMGLNLDVDHVAFASQRKFDGFQFRDLTPSELAQIAGRAGRHMRDGTFGVTGRVPPFEEDLIRALESHEFKPVPIAQWRNSVLDYSSLGALRASLDRVPDEQGLTRAPFAEDIQALDFLMRDDEVVNTATTAETVERLWGVCQIPDYRKIAPANHGDLVRRVHMFLVGKGRIPDDWLAEQVAYADRTDGDIDTLSNRIAHIRTWTFVANRPDWLDDPAYWRETTRAVEDRLSDALHECLTQRFVDRRTSVLMRRLKENAEMEAEITPDGDVKVADHHVGHLAGFRFTPDPTAEGPDAKALRAAANQALARAIEARADRVARAEDKAFLLTSDCSIRWDGAAIGRLVAGADVLTPRVILLADEQLTGPQRDAVQERLDRLISGYARSLLKPLFDLQEAQDLEGIARGVGFQLVESLGVLERSKVAEDVRQLDQTARAALRRYGVRFGAFHIYVPALLKPAPSRLLVDFWALFNDKQGETGTDELPHLLASGRTSIPYNAEIDADLYRLVGFKPCGERAVRIDILERLADQIRPILKWRPGQTVPDSASGDGRPLGAIPEGGGFRVTVPMMSLLGASGEDFSSVLKALGYRMERRTLTPEQLADYPPTGPVTGKTDKTDAAQANAGAASKKTDAAPAAEAPAASDKPDTAEATGAADFAEGVGETSTEAAETGAEPAGVAEPAAAAAEPGETGDAAPAAEPADTGEVTESADTGEVAEPADAGEAAEPAEAAAPAEAAETEPAVDSVSAEAGAPEADTAVLESAETAADPEAATGEAPEEEAPEEIVVEIWRPAGRGGPRRRDNQRGQRGAPGSRRDGSGLRREDGAAAPADKKDAPGNGQRDGPRQGGRGKRQWAEEGGKAANARGKPRKGGGKPPSGPRSAGPPKRSGTIDPDSPFAKLAALKSDLEKKSKDD